MGSGACGASGEKSRMTHLVITIGDAAGCLGGGQESGRADLQQGIGSGKGSPTPDIRRV
jgi:hypothetical protein